MNIVKQLRKRAGMKQEELASLLGISRPSVSGWENQKSDPEGPQLKKVAEIFGVDPLVVLGVMSPDGTMMAKGAPRTVEARILAAGIDKMPERDRERALNIVRLLFEQYADYFERTENNGN